MRQLFNKSALQPVIISVLIAITFTLSGCGAPPAKDYLSSDRITAWKNDIDYI